ncbi:hypothetical protein CRG98_042202 [Punica granatum]|uniref:Uncharacterized protein n=1 Tax=Punica granatum TaxID=22663 RepID=A0A2I0I1Q7_PUNGR|nr:hypothetical protein CRG98_042202 [Punica granatum]
MEVAVKMNPVRSKRVAAAFDEVAQGRGMCESSGSEHSATEEISPDNLSDLVASFMEKEGEGIELFLVDEEIEKCNIEDFSKVSDAKTMDTLRDLLGYNIVRDDAKEMISSKTGQRPAGDYQDIDVINANGQRYIVAVHLAAIFKIARPREQFTSMLGLFPLIFVGQREELKKLVRVMSDAMKQSMKRSELSMPPWRSEYMQSKWFGSYKRTTNNT